MAKTEKIEREIQHRRETVRLYAVKMHNVNDADIIGALNAAASKNGYVRSLIRADMRAQGFGDGSEPSEAGRFAMERERERLLARIAEIDALLDG